MQRVSAFLPTWERRNSSANKNAVSPSSPRSPRTSPSSSPSSPASAPSPSSSSPSATATTTKTTTTKTDSPTAAAAAATSTSAIALTDKSFTKNHKNSISSIASSTNGLFRWSHRSTASTKLEPPFEGALESVKIQREKFWPETLDLECDKAARILKSFCVDGFQAPVDHDDPVRPPSPSSFASSSHTTAAACRRIPKRIIQNAAGIAVFSCMRSGLWMTGSGGSGILIARKSDGTWSPPSGIMLHTPTLSFIIGVDIYDCVLVVSSYAALEAVTIGRVNLGNEVELRSGQTVPMSSDESEVSWRDLGDSVQTYMQARGRQQIVNMNGCILTERSNENERFYYADVTQMEILSGSVAKEVEETTPLFEVIKMAEGRTDYDQSVIDKVATEPTPSDAIISTPRAAVPASPQRPFGVVKQDDPDPFGVLALEMAGLEIREAGSRMRPTSSMIDIKLTPLSPIFSKFGRQSLATLQSTSDDRGSILSARSTRSQATDAAAQSEAGAMPEIITSLESGDEYSVRISPASILEETEEEEEEAQDEQSRHEEKEDHAEDDEARLESIAASAIVEARQEEEQEGAEAEAAVADEVEIVPVCPPLNPARLSARSARSSIVKKEQDEVAEEVSVKNVIDGEVAVEREAEDEDLTNDADDEDDVNEQQEVEEEDAKRTKHKKVDDDDSGEEAEKEAEDEDDEDDEDDEEEDGDEEEEEEEEPEVVVFEVAAVQPARTQAVASRMIQARGNVVTIAKRVPPPLPTRSPARMSRISRPEASERNPLRLSTNEADWGLRRGSTDSTAQETEHEEQATTVNGESNHAEANKEVCVGDESHLSEPQVDAAEHSDSASHKKHTSSIYTGITEDRWSCDGSSVNTPVSERRFSMMEDKTAEDITPTISKRFTTQAEKPAVRGSLSSLHEAMTQNSIVATE